MSKYNRFAKDLDAAFKTSRNVYAKRIPNTHRQNAPPKMHSDAPQMIPIIRMCCEWLKPK